MPCVLLLPARHQQHGQHLLHCITHGSLHFIANIGLVLLQGSWQPLCSVQAHCKGQQLLL
jgi:hypothetical protein